MAGGDGETTQESVGRQFDSVSRFESFVQGYVLNCEQNDDILKALRVIQEAVQEAPLSVRLWLFYASFLERRLEAIVAADQEEKNGQGGDVHFLSYQLGRGRQIVPPGYSLEVDDARASCEASQAVVDVLEAACEVCSHFSLHVARVDFARRRLSAKQYLRTLEEAAKTVGCDHRSFDIWSDLISLQIRVFNCGKKEKGETDGLLPDRLLFGDDAVALSGTEEEVSVLAPLSRQPEKEKEKGASTGTTVADLAVIRRNYGRWLAVPTTASDHWEAYYRFEKSLNVSRFIDELIPKYEATFTAARQMWPMIGSLYAHSLGEKEMNTPERLRDAETAEEQLRDWNRWVKVLQFEASASSPGAQQEVDGSERKPTGDDIGTQRVAYAWWRSLFHCAFVEEAWIVFSRWLDSRGFVDRATETLVRALDRFLPGSFPLVFELATRSEREGDIRGAAEWFLSHLSSHRGLHSESGWESGQTKGGRALAEILFFKFIRRNFGDRIVRQVLRQMMLAGGRGEGRERTGTLAWQTIAHEMLCEWEPFRVRGLSPGDPLNLSGEGGDEIPPPLSVVDGIFRAACGKDGPLEASEELSHLMVVLACEGRWFSRAEDVVESTCSRWEEEARGSGRGDVSALGGAAGVVSPEVKRKRRIAHMRGLLVVLWEESARMIREVGETEGVSEGQGRLESGDGDLEHARRRFLEAVAEVGDQRDASQLLSVIASSVVSSPFLRSFSASRRKKQPDVFTLCSVTRLFLSRSHAEGGARLLTVVSGHRLQGSCRSSLDLLTERLRDRAKRNHEMDRGPGRSPVLVAGSPSAPRTSQWVHEGAVGVGGFLELEDSALSLSQEAEELARGERRGAGGERQRGEMGRTVEFDPLSLCVGRPRSRLMGDGPSMEQTVGITAADSCLQVRNALVPDQIPKALCDFAALLPAPPPVFGPLSDAELHRRVALLLQEVSAFDFPDVPLHRFKPLRKEAEAPRKRPGGASEKRPNGVRRSIISARKRAKQTADEKDKEKEKDDQEKENGEGSHNGAASAAPSAGLANGRPTVAETTEAEEDEEEEGDEFSDSSSEDETWMGKKRKRTGRAAMVVKPLDALLAKFQWESYRQAKSARLLESYRLRDSAARPQDQSSPAAEARKEGEKESHPALLPSEKAVIEALTHDFTHPGGLQRQSANMDNGHPLQDGLPYNGDPQLLGLPVGVMKAVKEESDSEGDGEED